MRITVVTVSRKLSVEVRERAQWADITMDRSRMERPWGALEIERNEVREQFCQAAAKACRSAGYRKTLEWTVDRGLVSFTVPLADWREVVEALVEIEDGNLAYAKAYITRHTMPDVGVA